VSQGGLQLKSGKFIVDDDVDDSSDLDELCNEEEELFDTCCSICDNGGNILWYILQFCSSS